MNLQTASAEKVYLSAFAMGIRPDPEMTVSEWADTYRMLDPRSSAEPGRWRTSRTPYLREVMDCLSPSNPCKQVKVKKATQLGFTQAGMNWFGYIAHLAPGPAMMILPTDGTMKKHSRTKINPMIQETPVLRGIIHEPKVGKSETTTLFKEFAGGYWMLVGANSGSAFRNVSIRYLMADDVNGYPQNLKEEGDALSLGKKRQSSFSNRKGFILSTPTVKGASRISFEYEESDQRLYYVPCPFCGKYQPLHWSNIKFKHSENYALLNLPIYECEGCRKEISERYKTQMLEAGKWVAQNPGHPDAGFQLSALYSPAGWTSWADIVREFLEARKARDKELLMTWTNTQLAEDWEEKGQSADEKAIMNRLEKFSKTVPATACLITCGVDVQKGRLESEVKAWGPGEQSWSMEYRVFEGDTDTPTSEAWKDLDKYLAQPWKHESGIEMPISLTLIDSGDNTDTVYKWVKPRQHRRIFASKGSSKQGEPIISRMSKNKKIPVKLFLIGTDQAKEKILSRLQIIEPGPGYMHFPEGRSKEYFEQLTAEVLRTSFERGKLKRIWVKVRVRNEALDINVLSLAARTLLGWDLEKLMVQFQQRIDKFRKSDALPKDTNQAEGQQEAKETLPEAPKRVRLIQKKRPGGWATNWRGRP